MSAVALRQTTQLLEQLDFILIEGNAQVRISVIIQISERPAIESACIKANSTEIALAYQEGGLILGSSSRIEVRL